MPSPNGLGKPWGHGVALRRGTPPGIRFSIAWLCYTDPSAVRQPICAAHLVYGHGACPLLYLAYPRLACRLAFPQHQEAAHQKRYLGGQSQCGRTGVRGVTGCTLKIASSSGRTCLEHSPSMHKASLPGPRPTDVLYFQGTVFFPFPLELAAVCCPCGGAQFSRRHSLLGQGSFSTGTSSTPCPGLLC